MTTSSLSITITSRSQEIHGVRIFLHLLFKKYVKQTPSAAENDAMTVRSHAPCLEIKSGGSSHPLLTHSMGHTMSAMFLMYTYIKKDAYSKAQGIGHRSAKIDEW